MGHDIYDIFCMIEMNKWGGMWKGNGFAMLIFIIMNMICGDDISWF